MLAVVTLSVWWPSFMRSAVVWVRPIAGHRPETMAVAHAVLVNFMRLIPTRTLIPNDLSALHDEGHARHLGDIRERIARNGDNVGELALLDGADVGRPSDEIRGDRRGRAQRLHRCHPPLHQIGELILLRAVRERPGAAAERQHAAGRQRLLDALLHEAQAAVTEPA